MVSTPASAPSLPLYPLTFLLPAVLGLEGGLRGTKQNGSAGADLVSVVLIKGLQKY